MEVTQVMHTIMLVGWIASVTISLFILIYSTLTKNKEYVEYSIYGLLFFAFTGFLTFIPIVLITIILFASNYTEYVD